MTQKQHSIQNVGTIDAMIRITTGLTGLAIGIGRMARRPYKTPWGLLTTSAFLVAEGATRYCPINKALGVSTRKEDIISRAISSILPTGGLTTSEESRQSEQPRTAPSRNQTQQTHNQQGDSRRTQAATRTPIDRSHLSQNEQEHLTRAESAVRQTIPQTQTHAEQTRRYTHS